MPQLSYSSTSALLSDGTGGWWAAAQLASIREALEEALPACTPGGKGKRLMCLQAVQGAGAAATQFGYRGGGIGFPFIIPIFGFGGGGLFGFLILMSIVGVIINSVRGTNLPSAENSAISVNTTPRSISLIQLQIGLLASAKFIQNR